LLEGASVRTGLVGARGEKAAIAARRARRRRALSAGFTLVELMVVVVMVSILALLATPTMRTARDDRLAFDYARRIQQMIHRGRTRAAGRGGAHLFVASPSGANRGRFLLFEALDAAASPNGPNPTSSCKTANQWDDVLTFVPGAVSTRARIVEGLELNTIGVNVDADIRTAFFNNGASSPAVVMCVTPSGATFVGAGASVGAAIATMQAQTVSYTGTYEIRVTRNRGGTPIGLSRRVLNAGAAAPRILSQ